MLSVCGWGAGAVHGTSWELEEVRGNAVKTMLTLAAISTVASLQVFGKDRLIFWRESAAGAGSLSLPSASAISAGCHVCWQQGQGLMTCTAQSRKQCHALTPCARLCVTSD